MASNSPETAKKGSEKETRRSTIEYSSREVSPPPLLLAHIMQAHYVFSLHHGSSLSELFVRLSRGRFCGMLDRFWTRFCRNWDVLLHGNPATDMFSGLKLSSGGELGMGVGEEEWGSGERDVLEDLTRRTEGLVDLVVSRFGEPAPPHDESAAVEGENVPWLGSGNYPLASDGVIFGGINAITRPSLRNVSLWMRQIYTYGDYAYGVRDNPCRERRKRRRRNPPALESESEPAQERRTPLKSSEADDLLETSKDISAQDHATETLTTDSAKSHQSAQGPEDSSISSGEGEDVQEHRPGIPPPIVSVVQQSLDDATKKASSGGYQPNPAVADGSGTTLGIPDQYMKYLTFGLSTLAKQGIPNRPDPPHRTSTSSSKTITPQRSQAASRTHKYDDVVETDEDGPALAQMDPMPDAQTLKDKIAIQKRQEEGGMFVVGLKGDLQTISGSSEVSIDEIDDESCGVRNVLRTLQIEVVPTATKDEDKTELQRKLIDAGLTGARNDPLNFKRLRVLVYVRRPFMYCFLFDDRTPALGIAQFYKTLHQSLEPTHKPLLSSTSATKIARRIEEAQASESTSDSASVTSGGKSAKTPEPKPIFDLIWDPALLTVHTSIPNIPEPGTPAAEGILPGRKDLRLAHAPDWTRIEALNVHSQILNTHASTQRNSHEYERSSKTTRGWWVVWLKLSPSKTHVTAASKEAEQNQDAAKEVGEAELDDLASKESVDSEGTTQATANTKQASLSTNRIAFLVRKATDTTPALKSDVTSVTSRAATSMWQTLSLRSNSAGDEATGGTNAGWGPAALAGGIGIDARKYVEGLLQLNR